MGRHALAACRTLVDSDQAVFVARQSMCCNGAMHTVDCPQPHPDQCQCQDKLYLNNVVCAIFMKKITVTDKMVCKTLALKSGQ